LSDARAKVAQRCRIAFTLSDELRPAYTAAGRRPPPEGHDNWLLPLPATYVVDWTGAIVFSYVDTDYTSRLDPADVITILAHLARRMDRERPHRVWSAPWKGAAPRRGSY
jgi:peroxiredoxin